MPIAGANTTGSQTEQRLLKVSMVAITVLGAIGIIWGWLSGSSAILFDGAYTTIGLVLTWLSLRASRIVAAGPTTNYPFGREALAPLVIMIQGIALLGTLGYAVVTSVLTIFGGGSEMEALSGIAYGLLSGAAALGLWLYLRGYGRTSDLVKAEAAQWLAGLALSAGMAVGFTVAFALDAAGMHGVVPFIDPILVIVACLSLVKIPLDMVRETALELLEGAPPEAVQAPIRELVARVTAEHGLTDPTVRMAKLGAKLYLEIDYVVTVGTHDTAFLDQLRRSFKRELATQPLDVWLNVDLSTDASWQH